MPIQDAQLALSVSQAVTASAVSTNTIDLASSPLGLPRNVAAGASLGDDALTITINVEQTVTAAGAATVNFQVITSTLPNLSSPTILCQSDAIPKATLVAGFQLFLPVARAFAGNQLGQRYLGLQYTVGTGPLTAGVFSAWLGTGGVDSRQIYPTGYSVK